MIVVKNQETGLEFFYDKFMTRPQSLIFKLWEWLK
jgi:hypothetical protein